ncbi:MAG: nitroreductase family protein [Chloroflexota bacterium]
MAQPMTAESLHQAIYTNRAIRRFTADPVPDQLLEQVLDAAIRAPSGAIRQHWRFIVVRDAATRAALGRLYGESFREVYTAERIANPTSAQQGRVLSSAAYLAETMGTEPPVLIVACLDNEPGAAPANRLAGSSIYPAVQNLMLAARSLGLGTCLTTLHARREAEVKAVLGIPEHVDTYALIPLGYPATPFGPLTRTPWQDVTYRDRWGQR